MEDLLKEYRKELNDIDSEIIELLDERFNLCWEIGGYKKENGIPVLDEKQEMKKYSQVEKAASPDNADAVKAVFETIISESRKIQQKL